MLIAFNRKYGDNDFTSKNTLVDLSSESQITWLDELILGEFAERLNGFKSFSFDKEKIVLYDYLRVCKYRARLLYLVKRFYPNMCACSVCDNVECRFTCTLLNCEVFEQPEPYIYHGTVKTAQDLAKLKLSEFINFS